LRPQIPKPRPLVVVSGPNKYQPDSEARPRACTSPAPIFSVSTSSIAPMWSAFLKSPTAWRPMRTAQRITRVLDGAILGNMFFEPSTRTRRELRLRLQPARRRSARDHRIERLRRSPRANRCTTRRASSAATATSSRCAIRRLRLGEAEFAARQPRAGGQRRRRGQRAPHAGAARPLHHPQGTAAAAAAASTGCASR
jgi:hypothetical protein